MPEWRETDAGEIFVTNCVRCGHELVLQAVSREQRAEQVDRVLRRARSGHLEPGAIEIHPANMTTDRLRQLADQVINWPPIGSPWWYAEVAMWAAGEVDHLRAENQKLKREKLDD